MTSLKFLAILAVLFTVLACQRGQPHAAKAHMTASPDPSDGDPMEPSSGRVSLEAQLENLKAAGITLNPGVSEADLVLFDTKERARGKTLRRTDCGSRF